MKQVRIGELRRRANELIDELAQSGEPIEITRRGRPIARLLPVPQPTHLQSLISDGTLLPPTRPWNPPEPLAPRPGVPLPSELLAQLRAEER